MIGGTLKAIKRMEFGGRDTLRLLVQGNRESEANDFLHVHVAVTNYKLRIGDSIWWQGAKVLWTPANKRHRDLELEKVGHSYSV